METGSNKKQLQISKGVTLVIVGALLFCGGFFAGTKTHNVEAQTIGGESMSGVDMSVFWKVWKTLDEKSVYKDKADAQARVYGAAQGLAQSLKDPYTVFFNPEENKMFKSQIEGHFGGVGMEVAMKDGVITVVAPLKGTPAEKAGIKSGDKVLKIGTKSTNNMTIEDAIALIRGEAGTAVDITIYRDGEKDTRVISLTRATIVPPIIDTETKGDVYVIRLYNFGEQSSNAFRDALKTFVLSGKSKLIIDLRGNPGGYLESAVDIASWFLPKEAVVVSEDFGTKKDPVIYHSSGYNIFNENLKMIILVDGGSASASEILAGALKEQGKAKLVGTKTFGKGSVQEVVDITKDTALKVTIAKWLTPNGVSISENGLQPDYVIKSGSDPKKDLQMEKALELMK
ncbi:MAG: S41 family peptidase [bacterium]